MQRLRGGLGGAVAVLGAALLIVAATLVVRPRMIDIGAAEPATGYGLYRAETIAENWLAVRDTTFRWTDGAAEVWLPRSYAGRALLELTLADARPGTAATALTVTVDGLSQAFAVPRDSYRRYRLLTPPQDWFAPLRVTLQAPTELSPNGEPYATALFALRLTPLGPAWLPGGWLIGWALSAAGALLVLMRALLGPRRAPWAVLLLSLGWAALIVTRPTEIAPFLSRVSGLLALAALTQLAARRLRALSDDTALVLTLLCGLTPWLMLIGHWLIVWSARPVTAADHWTTAVALLTLSLATLLLSLPRMAAALRLQRLLELTAAAAVAGLLIGTAAALRDNAYDFMAHWEGLQRLRNGGRLYLINQLYGNHFAAVFKIPPFYALLYQPLLGLAAEQALLIWRAFNGLLAVGSGVLLWHMLRRERSGLQAALLLTVFFHLRPLTDSLAYGQTDPLLLALLTLLLMLWQRGRSLTAGVVLGFAGLIKLYPLLLVLWWLRRRDWRALGGVALGLTGGTLLSLAVLGPAPHRTFLFEVLPLIGGTTNWIENQTISGVVTRLSGEIIKLRPFSDVRYTLLGLLLSAALVALVAWLQQPQRPRESPAAALEFGGWTMLFALAAPAAWLHYHTLLILPLAALLPVLRRQQWGAAQLGWAGIGWALVAYGNHRSFTGGPTTDLLSLVGMSGRFVGLLLLLWLVLAAQRRADSAPAEGLPPRS